MAIIYQPFNYKVDNMVESQKNSFEQNCIIAEYNSLRAEILAQDQRRSSRFVSTSATIFALFSLAFLIKSPELVAISIPLISAGWHDDHNCRKNVMRMGAYIYYFIESEHKGIRWEHVISSYTDRDPPEIKQKGTLIELLNDKKLKGRVISTFTYGYGSLATIAIASLVCTTYIFFAPELLVIWECFISNKSCYFSATLLLFRSILTALIFYISFWNLKKAFISGVYLHTETEKIRNNMKTKKEKYDQK